ncbi:hypothetical protein N7449_000547 [Penicillium cf. viridicatum]|uniref:CCHC-type domain-containing protein n=1 Tax=Penicillium cf. viridicatum TaxID=2972119 RepID=A0A9W9T8E7_9EURO|nr:hypothetical protein N7449_000547 [Penicillium cf. viridicatum]
MSFAPLLRNPYAETINNWHFYRSPWSNQSTSLGENAGLKRQTYAVVVHGVTCRFSPSATDARRQLKAENVRRISTAAEIVYMNWLMTKRKMDETRPESAKLLIEFADPYAANQAILRGLAIYGRNHHCQFFDGSHRLQKCYRCQMYGHIARNCKRDNHCAYCAGDYDSKECPHAHDRRKAKCAECVRRRQTRKALLERPSTL